MHSNAVAAVPPHHNQMKRKRTAYDSRFVQFGLLSVAEKMSTQMCLTYILKHTAMNDELCDK